MIQIEELSFSYKRTPVFDRISLSFEKGNIYGLLGENGVGKTTMLKLICGLQQPQSGRCEVDGRVAFRRDPELLQNILFLPDSITLPDRATPEQYVRQWAPFYPRFSNETFLELMRELSVDPKRRFREMSFGQQKKSLLACVLSFGTDYVLLDESTNGLDIPSKADFRRLLSRRSNEESTIIISTHQVTDVENLIDPIIIINKNDVLLNASVSEITEKLCFTYDTEPSSESLYSERQPGGCLNVRVNMTHEESAVNIEALFNAVLRNSNKIKELFAK